MKNWLRNKLRSWLGIKEVSSNIDFKYLVDRVESCENRIKLISQDIGRLEHKWVANGPDKIKIATTSGSKWIDGPMDHNAQSLMNLITAKKKKAKK